MRPQTILPGHQSRPIPMLDLPEPSRTDFVRLIREGAGSIDIIGHHEPGRASAQFIERELRRPKEHLQNICRYIQHLAPTTVLDVGCGTGGLTVALAATYPQARIIGVDAVHVTLSAAHVRAAACGANARFIHVANNAPLPFADKSFDLVTCTSVIEFITDPDHRRQFVRELTRVARGYIVVTTPNPVPRFREQHSRRWFGDFRRTPEAPWASTRTELDRLFAPLQPVAVPDRVRDKLHSPAMPALVAGLIERAMPWQFRLYAPPDVDRQNRANTSTRT